jgi:hypothetical protein
LQPRVKAMVKPYRYLPQYENIRIQCLRER